MTALLTLTDVSLSLGDGAARVEALAEIDLTVSAGQLVAVTGRSGSGKSSLLNCAGGLASVTSGSVVVAGEDLATLSPKQLAARRRRSIGYVFQELNLLSTLTAVENAALPLELDGTRVGQARALAEAALERLGVAGIAERFPDEMSGGQRQRVAIARGIAGDRRLLLADEPTGALDEVTSEQVMALIRTLCDEGAAALVVTHDPSLAAWADSVIRLRDGRVEAITQATR